MSDFFKKLSELNDYNEWATIFDWLFDDKKFKYWTSGYVGSLTKKIKRLQGIGNNNYTYDTYSNIEFPSINESKTLEILMVKGNGEGKDIIRHVRNSIAHGNASISKLNGTPYIEIIDKNKNGMQTAYIFFPLEYIEKIYELYKDVEKSKNNQIKKDRKIKKSRNIKALSYSA
ncbi:MAG: hypothetical protein IJJ41_07245 [Clostridia bacterium]|nr:hypothetical protein [Clostridia bacterium]